MKNKRRLHIFFVLLVSLVLFSCENEKSILIDYNFEVARDVSYNITDFQKVKFETDKDLDLSFYKGQVWIKLEITNSENPQSFVVLCNDLINHNYRFYKFDTLQNKFISQQKGIDLEKYDHRSYRFANPNFKIDLDSCENAVFLITTTSDGRILQATPQLISLDQFLNVKLRSHVFDFVFYSLMLILLLLNIFYYRLIRSDIYLYYGAYIISGCFMYLLVEGRLYGLGLSNKLVDHLIFIFIRLWVLSSLLFTMKLLDTKVTYYKYYRFILIMLGTTLGITTIYQLLFYSFSISTLHQLENIIGFLWIIFSLVTLVIAFKKRKIQSIYYLISYSTFLLFVTLGLIDSHTSFLPGDPFSYFKIGTTFEFFGFTYFINLLVKDKLMLNSRREKELFEYKNILSEKENQLARNNGLVSVIKLVENSFLNESDWEEFKNQFELLNPNFIVRLEAKHPNLSKSEIRMLMFIKIGYTQKEIATILHIAPDSVKKARARLRRKLALEEKDNLVSYLNQF